MALLLTLLIPAQCAAPPGRDSGGDRNQWTGNCKIEYEETLSTGHHRYPEYGEGGWVVGKVIMFCDRGRPPATQHTTLYLEFWRDESWRQVNANTSREVPAPKAAVYTQGTCRNGYWRVRVAISGTGPDGAGSFQVEDASPRRRIECKDR